MNPATSRQKGLVRTEERLKKPKNLNSSFEVLRKS